ncbi:hypothetical protein ACFL6C_05045 [Myxococcota bacterium]
MAERIDELRVDIDDIDATQVSSSQYDIGIWAAGYESRAGWLVQSEFKPRLVKEWHRVEFLEHRDSLSAPANLSLGLGSVVGASPASSQWDGHWYRVWCDLLAREFKRFGRRMSLFADYSSMPRTVYGPLLFAVFGICRELVESLTLAYVPGKWDPSKEGSTEVKGLRSLVETGHPSQHAREPAFLMGLGYDGVLAEAILELFQVNHFSSFYADPGVTEDAVERARTANADVLVNSELVATAPAWSIPRSCRVCLELAEWYLPQRDVILIILGPKPHVVGGILAAVVDRRIAYRISRAGRVRPVQVTVPDGAVPFFAELRVSP